MKCSEHARTFKTFIEKNRVYDFLLGLNVGFDQFKVQILSKKDLPSLNKITSIIVEEEN